MPQEAEMLLMKPTQNVSVRRLDLATRKDEVSSEEVAVQTPITIYVNRKLVATLFATPTSQEELAVGHLIGEGILRSYSDIRSVTTTEHAAAVYVRTKTKARVRSPALRTVKVLASVCGTSDDRDFERLLDRIDRPFVRSDHRVSVSEIVRMMKDFDDQSRNLRKSGSFQYAAAFLDAKLRAFFEDVGLNNAVDKTLGAVLKMQIDPSRTVLLSSGRLSAVEVLKAARIRIPVIVSLRGPVYSGVRAAEKTGVALCSFAGGSWMNVYAGFDRIIFGL